MADETKVKIDIGSVEDVGEKLGKGAAKGFKEGVEDAVESLNSGDLKKQFAKTFSVDGLKKDLAEGFKKGLAGSEKEQKRQKDMAGLLKKNAELSKKFTSSIASGASKSQILNNGLKLAGNHIAGMLKGMNPYVAALKIAAETAKQFLEGYQKALQASTKFVSSNSLLTDKATMSMMQRTGQSASGAQGTIRSLDRLGLDFNDLQIGNVTKAQMEMFEKLRKEETARLEVIQRVGGPVFESMQKGAIAIATAKAKFMDMITFAYAKSKGVLQFSKALEGVATTIGDMFWSAKSIITPIVNIVGTVFGSIMQVVGIVADLVKNIVDAVAPAFDMINNIIDLISTTLGRTLKGISQIVNAVLKPVFTMVGTFISNLMVPLNMFIQLIGGIVDAVFMVLDPILGYITMISDVTNGLIPVKNALAGFQPILDVIITGIKIVGAGIGWLVGKMSEGIQWAIGKIGEAVSWLVNLIPKAFHDMVDYVIDLLNKIPGVNIAGLGDYKGINIASALNNLNDKLNQTLVSIQGDTFNYNYNSNSASAPTQPIANQSLFQNTYTIVND